MTATSEISTNFETTTYGGIILDIADILSNETINEQSLLKHVMSESMKLDEEGTYTDPRTRDWSGITGNNSSSTKSRAISVSHQSARNPPTGYFVWRRFDSLPRDYRRVNLETMAKRRPLLIRKRMFSANQKRTTGRADETSYHYGVAENITALKRVTGGSFTHIVKVQRTKRR